MTRRRCVHSDTTMGAGFITSHSNLISISESTVVLCMYRWSENKMTVNTFEMQAEISAKLHICFLIFIIFYGAMLSRWSENFVKLENQLVVKVAKSSSYQRV